LYFTTTPSAPSKKKKTPGVFSGLAACMRWGRSFGKDPWGLFFCVLAGGGE
jgi:hypothetical protein